MSVQIKVEAAAKEPRIWDGQKQWGVKTSSVKTATGWVTLHREAQPTKGEIIDVNIIARPSKNGQTTYTDAFPVMPPLAPQAEPTPPPPAETKAEEMWSNNTGKKVSWDATREFVKAAHNLALVLEPDEYNPDENGPAIIRTDKSTARAAITNTLVIAYTSGKIFVPADDDGYVPPDEDDIPPF